MFRKSKDLLVAIIVFYNLVANSAYAADRYVRPYSLTTSYGAENGTSHADAWNGFWNVAWDNGVNSVVEGDVLHICGMHPDPVDSPYGSALTYPNQNMTLEVGASGTEVKPVTISFACDDNGNDDSGVVLRVDKQFKFDSGADGNVDPNLTTPVPDKWMPVPNLAGVYATINWGTVSVFMEYNRTAAPNAVLDLSHEFRRLRIASGAPGVAQDAEWTGDEGAGYKGSGNMMYYKPSPGVTNSVVYGTPASPYFINIVNHDFVRVVGKNENLDPMQPVNFQQVDLLGGGVYVKESTDNKIDHLVSRYVYGRSISLSKNCHDADVGYNRLEYSLQGIYNTNNGLSPCNGMKIHHNYIGHMNDDVYWPNIQDKHGIQMETGSDHIIEHNHIEYAGSHGIAMDLKGDIGAIVKNNTIRYNFIRNTGSEKDFKFNETGFHLEGAVDNLDGVTTENNLVHNNIFAGSSRAGIYIVGATKQDVGYSWEFYNNVLHQNTINWFMSDSFDRTDPKYKIGFRFINNLITSPQDSTFAKNASTGHVEHQQGGSSNNLDRSAVDVDYNLYWPVDNASGLYSPLFDWVNIPCDSLECWKDATLTDGPGLDRNSIGADPLYVNASGMFSDKEDYMLQALSPAIDEGFNVGITKDLAGNPIYGKPDIGAFEYQPPYKMKHPSLPEFPANSDTIAESVRIYGDGRYRDLPKPGAPVNFRADLNIFPQTANDPLIYTYPTGDYRHWMDVEIEDWSLNRKVWTVTREPGTGNDNGNNNLKYFIRGIETARYYYVCLDGAYWITGRAYGDGIASFALGHPGGVSHKFEMVLADAASSSTCNIQ